jgi:hypothetical protein
MKFICCGLCKLQTVCFAVYFLSLDASIAACSIINGRALGDCNGVNVNTESSGFKSITKYTYEAGIISGAIVRSGGSYSLSGSSNNAITVESNGFLDLRGKGSSVIVEGGKAHISGILESLIVRSGSASLSGSIASVSGTGKLTIEEGAFVAGHVRRACEVIADNIHTCPTLE